MTIKTPQLNELSPQTVHDIQQNQQQAIALIDVREPSEFAREHIKNAINIPLSQISPDNLPTKPENITLYCQSGQRSQQAADKLHNAGLSQISQLSGGLNHWKSTGLPIQEDKKAPLPIMRQVQIGAGSLILVGTILSAIVSPWFLLLTGFVGSGLLFAGTTGFCGMARLLLLLPYNQVKS
ncbi:MAG: rhodanese-like domain-containing protein [Limnothrix sp.]